MFQPTPGMLKLFTSSVLYEPKPKRMRLDGENVGVEQAVGEEDIDNPDEIVPELNLEGQEDTMEDILHTIDLVGDVDYQDLFNLIC